MSRGGARVGSGRKPTGPTQVVFSFKIAPALVAQLRAAVPVGKRSRFVAAAITRSLAELVA